MSEGKTAKKKGSWNTDDADRPKWKEGVTIVKGEYEYQRADGSYSFTIRKGWNEAEGEKAFELRRPNPLSMSDRINPEDMADYLYSLGDQKAVLFRLPKLIAEAKAKKRGWRVIFVEGEKDVETAERLGLLATTNPFGAGKFLPEFAEFFEGADLVVIADADEVGRTSAATVLESCRSRARALTILEMPAPFKDLTEWWEDQVGKGLAPATIGRNLEALISPVWGNVIKPPAPRTLGHVHEVFERWFGDEYELMVIDVAMASAAAERFKDGEPVWTIVVSGPGNAKTETVQSLGGLAYAWIVSSISSEGALLSASPKKSHVKTATGGLLRQIGNRGLLIVKDFTSILSMDHKTRGQVLAAFREMYDGKWVRNVGSDGGQTLTWTGKIGVIMACTTILDYHHAVISAAGDRYLTIRSDSSVGREGSTRKAIRNTGSEEEMRKELSEAVAGLLSNADYSNPYQLSDDEENWLIAIADVITMARTAVEKDYRGNIINAHALEMPTRLAKQLTQLIRGGIAIGMTKEGAKAAALRVARDSMPPLRLAVLEYIAANPGSRVMEVRRRLDKPRATVDIVLQELHALGLLTVREKEEERAGKMVQARFYSLSDGFSIKPISEAEDTF